MVEKRSEPIPLVMVLHTAVDYLYGQGAGIGVVQRAECATTGIIRNQIIPNQERRYGITREKLGVENVKTAERAQMLALVHALGLALGLAYGTIKQGRSRAFQPQKVTVFSASVKAVQTINHHIKQASNSLRDVASTNDRSIIKRVIARVQRLSRCGLEVVISISDGKGKAAEKARTLARQRGRKACKSRRRLRLAHVHSIGERADAAGDQETFELVIRAKESPEGMEQEQITVYNG